MRDRRDAGAHARAGPVADRLSPIQFDMEATHLTVWGAGFRSIDGRWLAAGDLDEDACTALPPAFGILKRHGRRSNFRRSAKSLVSRIMVIGLGRWPSRRLSDGSPLPVAGENPPGGRRAPRLGLLSCTGLARDTAQMTEVDLTIHGVSLWHHFANVPRFDTLGWFTVGLRGLGCSGAWTRN